jgi:2,4-dienoyl-CoA reductase-like NADH-dependent reductase (Old Yellow Enzyme family)
VEELFSPFESRGLVLPNRLALAPMTTYSSQPDGQISDDEPPYLRRRAEGGIGMMITAACYVHESGHAFRGQWGCHSDAMMPSLRSVADAIHEGGGQAFLQIHHGGRQCPPDLAGGECISASDVPYPREGATTPRAMTEAEIERTIQDFADAAVRAKRAGFDGVEIHGANTYLLQQFVSPQSNRRTDAWGPDDFKFPRELTSRVLDAVGPDFPVGYRFSPEEPETPGIRLDRTTALLDDLLQFPLAFLHISLRQYDQPSLHDEQSAPVLQTIAQHIGGRTALIGVGGVKSLADAKATLALGADLVAVGRVAVSEPEFGNKLQSGSDVRTKLPKHDFAEELSVPRGLTDKIFSVPGWFEMEG